MSWPGWQSWSGREALKRILAEPPRPLLTSGRELMLRKCVPAKQTSIRTIFEREPFGALEHLVIQKLLDVVKKVAREQLGDEQWLRRMARLSRRSYTHMRVIVLDFLETEALGISADHYMAFFDPLIEVWDIDLATFAMEIVLNRRLASAHSKRFEFVGEAAPIDEEPRATRVPRGSHAERRHHSEGTRVSEEVGLCRKTTDGAVLLPGAAKPARPAAFPVTQNL